MSYGAFQVQAIVPSKVPVKKLGELGGVSQNFQTGSRMLHNGLYLACSIP